MTVDLFSMSVNVPVTIRFRQFLRQQYVSFYQTPQLPLTDFFRVENLQAEGRMSGVSIVPVSANQATRHLLADLFHWITPYPAFLRAMGYRPYACTHAVKNILASVLSRALFKRLWMAGRYVFGLIQRRFRVGTILETKSLLGGPG